MVVVAVGSLAALALAVAVVNAGGTSSVDREPEMAAPSTTTTTSEVVEAAGDDRSPWRMTADPPSIPPPAPTLPGDVVVAVDGAGAVSVTDDAGTRSVLPPGSAVGVDSIIDGTAYLRVACGPAASLCRHTAALDLVSGAVVDLGAISAPVWNADRRTVAFALQDERWGVGRALVVREGGAADEVVWIVDDDANPLASIDPVAFSVDLAELYVRTSPGEGPGEIHALALDGPGGDPTAAWTFSWNAPSGPSSVLGASTSPSRTERAENDGGVEPIRSLELRGMADGVVLVLDQTCEIWAEGCQGAGVARWLVLDEATFRASSTEGATVVAESSRTNVPGDPTVNLSLSGDGQWLLRLERVDLETTVSVAAAGGEWRTVLVGELASARR